MWKKGGGGGLVGATHPQARGKCNPKLKGAEEEEIFRTKHQQGGEGHEEEGEGLENGELAQQNPREGTHTL